MSGDWQETNTIVAFPRRRARDWHGKALIACMFAVVSRRASRLVRGSNICWSAWPSRLCSVTSTATPKLYSEAELLERLNAIETNSVYNMDSYDEYLSLLDTLHPSTYPTAMSTILYNLHRRRKKTLYKMNISPLLRRMYGLYISRPSSAVYESSHLANILIAAFATNPKNARAMGHLLSFVRPHMTSHMKASDIVRCYRALQTLQYQPHLQSYYDLLHSHAMTCREAFEQHHLTDIFYGLSHQIIPGCDDLLLYFYHQHLARLSEPLCMSTIASVAYSLRGFSNTEPQPYVDSVIPFLSQHLESCDVFVTDTSLAMIMHGLRNMKYSQPLDVFLKALVSKLHKPMPLNARNISDIFLGLQSFVTRHATVDQLLDMLSMWLHASASLPSFAVLSPGHVELFAKIPLYESDASLRFVSAALRLFPDNRSTLNMNITSRLCWCFRDFKNSETMTAVLNTIASHLKQHERINRSHFVRLMCSLQNKTSRDSKAVRRVLVEVTRLSRNALSAPHNMLVLSPYDFSLIAFGMQEMNTMHQSVRAMFGLLEELMPDGEYSAEMVMLICRGLQQADSSAALLVQQLAHHVQIMTEKLTVNQFAMCLYGLRSMNDCDAAYALVSALLQKCGDLSSLKAHECAWILFGLHQLHPQKLRDVYDRIRPVLNKINDWTPQYLVNCIYGLIAAKEESDMMNLLLSQLSECIDSVKEKHALRLLQTLRFVSMHYAEDTSIQKTLSRIISEIHSCYATESKPPDALLEQFVNGVHQLRPHYSTYCNVFIDDFPVDLLLCVHRRNRAISGEPLSDILERSHEYHLLNIQIEGNDMQTSYHKHNLSYRDRYLQHSHGIDTCRIDARRMNEVPSLVTLLRRELFLYRFDVDCSDEEEQK